MQTLTLLTKKPPLKTQWGPSCRVSKKTLVGFSLSNLPRPCAGHSFVRLFFLFWGVSGLAPQHPQNQPGAALEPAPSWGSSWSCPWAVPSEPSGVLTHGRGWECSFVLKRHVRHLPDHLLKDREQLKYFFSSFPCSFWLFFLALAVDFFSLHAHPSSEANGERIIFPCSCLSPAPNVS